MKLIVHFIFSLIVVLPSSGMAEDPYYEPDTIVVEPPHVDDDGIGFCATNWDELEDRLSVDDLPFGIWQGNVDDGMGGTITVQQILFSDERLGKFSSFMAAYGFMTTMPLAICVKEGETFIRQEEDGDYSYYRYFLEAGKFYISETEGGWFEPPFEDGYYELSPAEFTLK